MIRFFRQIRQRLIPDNKFSKYLLYAVGEILLVVMGILIALQIDNWNEDRKMKTLEFQILSEMQSNLNTDLKDAEYNLRRQSEILNCMNQIINHLEYKEVYQDSLPFYYANVLGTTMQITNTSAFENLKSTGFGLISNDKVRRQITHLYTERYPHLASIEINFDNHLLNTQMAPMMVKYINTTRMWEYALPYDIEELRKNTEFFEVIKLNRFMRQFMIDNYEELKRTIEILNEDIALEISKEHGIR